jgi:hypothetical protein
MIVHDWASSRSARAAERLRIYQALGNRLPLFNYEAKILGKQWPLF